VTAILLLALQVLAGPADTSAGMRTRPPLFEEDRPAWEIHFTDLSNSVLSIMPGESGKSFYDPLIRREVKWEQDVYCPTFTVFDGKLCCVYRSWGEDEQWRMGLAWSEDGLHFTRSDKPVFHARPEDEFLGSLRDLKDASVSYGDSRIFAAEDGAIYLLFNYFSVGRVNTQQLAIASTRDLKHWTMHGRIFAKQAARDSEVIPEKAPWRFPHPAIVTRLEGDRFVVTKIRGRYWMYLNCLTRKEDECCLCMATSENMIDWQVLRDAKGRLAHPMPLRPGYFDSLYVDTTAAVLRDDGILLIYNGINAEPKDGGDPRRRHRSHYPGQALFDRDEPFRLLKRCESPFKGGDADLEKKPIVFWSAPLYESWSLVPWRGELLLYWNHAFGRRAVGVWKAPIPGNMRVSATTRPQAQ
jgi:beta-1,2-mannosidase